MINLNNVKPSAFSPKDFKMPFKNLQFGSNFANEPKPVTGGGSPIIDGAIDVIDRATSIPGRISDFGDNLNDEMIDFLNRFRKGEDVAKENLTRQKVKGTASKIGTFLQENWGSVLSVILAFVAWRVLK